MRKLLVALFATILLSTNTFAAISGLAQAAPTQSTGTASTQTATDSYERKGTGNQTLTGVTIQNGFAAARFTYNGTGTFSAVQVFPDGKNVVLVNTTGAFNTSVPIDASKETTLQIQATGDWSVSINPGVYWGETGLKYHISKRCPSFQETNPNFGSIGEAKASGRIGWCLICSDGIGGLAKTAAQPTVGKTGSADVVPVTTQPAKSAPAQVANSAPASVSVAAATPAPAAVSKPAPTKSIGQTVYRTPTGKKYHYANPCGNGSYSPCTLEEAQRAGLKPCEKCVG